MLVLSTADSPGLPPLRGATFEIDESSPYLIGRGKACQIRLGGRTASRKHAIVSYDEGCWWICDNGSKYGTFLNDEQLENESSLDEGDHIRIGQYTFEVDSIVASEDELGSMETAVGVPALGRKTRKSKKRRRTPRRKTRKSSSPPVALMDDDDDESEATGVIDEDFDEPEKLFSDETDETAIPPVELDAEVLTETAEEAGDKSEAWSEHIADWPVETTATVVGAGAKIKGEISGGEVHVRGQFEGSIKAGKTVRVFEDANCRADVLSPCIEIEGSVAGSLTATSSVRLTRKAQFEGTISSPSLSVEEGAQIAAHCSINT